MLRPFAALCLLASPTFAQDLGCYTRTYSDDHLARTPAQHVAALRILFKLDQTADISQVVAAMDVRFAHQGRALAEGFGGRTLDQLLYCFESGDGGFFCGVECDGGNFSIIRQSSGEIVIETNYVLVGDASECGGEIDLAEVDREAVRYRLNSAPVSDCNGLN